MSDPQDPLDPGDAAPATPVYRVPTPPPFPLAPPPMPVPVIAQPYPYGAPMGVMPYTEPNVNTRPGLVTAMGVASLIIGIIGIITAGFASFTTMILVAVSSASASMVNAVDPTGPNGYDSSDRRIIVQALHQRQRLSNAQRDQLTWFVADAGKTYLPAVPMTATTDYATANVTDAGPATEGTGMFFDVPMGRLIVTDTSSKITLADGTTISRTADRSNPANFAQFSPQEIGAVVNRAQEMAYNTPMSAAQVAGLNQQLTTSGSTVLGTPKDMPTLLGQVVNVTNSGGAFLVEFRNAVITLAPSGQAGLSILGPANTPRAGPPKLAKTPSMILLLSGIAIIGLSTYLLVIGVLTLRNSPRGGLMHRIYAWLQIVVSLVAGYAMGSLILHGGGSVGWAWFWGLAIVVVGILYPIILLLVLPAKSMREWYSVQHVAA